MRVMRARYARRETADARSVLGWPGIVFAAASILILAAPANAQEAANVGALSGTLKKIKDTGTIALGYRESSLPFSYLNRRQQPIGYSIDLCREIVEDVSTELDSQSPAKGGVRRDRSRMWLDHRQCPTSEGSRILANLFCRRHQADGAEVLFRPLLP